MDGNNTKRELGAELTVVLEDNLLVLLTLTPRASCYLQINQVLAQNRGFGPGPGPCGTGGTIIETSLCIKI